MSADNGIYVLYTETEKGPEYRVAYAHAIENIYGEYNEDTGTYNGNLQNIKDTFADSQVFYSLNEALDFAEKMEYDYEYLEYGIAVISEFRDLGYILS